MILLFLSSCNGLKNQKEINIKENKLIRNEGKEKLKVSVACKKSNIDNYISKGWRITKEYSEEKICSWKSVPANKNCDMEKDKGCKLTVPDKIGKEIIYFLER
tara:strand:+ start:2677 stop:2985 length:309 start_codon:yes stop_codon:yes gene_type:complete